MRNDFAIFICTHGRPDKQLTLNTLRKCGYTGKIYLVLDDTDDTIQQYIDNYGTDYILIFDKNYYINSKMYDNGDNVGHYKCIVYAKRAIEDIAQALQIPYFVIADDDITNLVIRYPEDSKLKTYQITDFDSIVDAYINLLVNNVAGVGFGYVTSYFRGYKTFDYKNLCLRNLPYQFVFRNGRVPVNWTSWMAEDDITELLSSSVGNFWISVPFVMQVMKPIGDVTGSGGMADTYKQFDKFKLNFNIIKYCPRKTVFINKSNKYTIMRYANNCFPKLISEVYRNE